MLGCYNAVRVLKYNLIFLFTVMMWCSETLSFLHTINLAVFAAYAVLITLVLLAVLKAYNWLTTGVYRGTTSMKGKTVIVTGANSGKALKSLKYPLYIIRL